MSKRGVVRVGAALLLVCASAGALLVTPAAAQGSVPVGTRAEAATAAAPSTPQNVVVNVESGAIDVSWAAPSANGGSPIVAYVLQVSAGGPSVTVPAATTATTIDGLADGLVRTLTIRAWNIFGPGSAVVVPFQAPAPLVTTPATTVADDRYYDIARGPAGSVYLAAMDRIERIDSVGNRTTVVSGTFTGSVPENTLPNETPTQPRAIAVASNGDVYWYDNLNDRIRRLSGGRVNSVAGNGDTGAAGDGNPATTAQVQAAAIAVAPNGAVFFADRANHVIRRFVVGGNISRVAGILGVSGGTGDGGPATSALLSQPADIAVDDGGAVYVADYGNHVVRTFTPGGNISRLVGSGSSADPQPDQELDPLSANLPSPMAIDWSSEKGLMVDTRGMERILTSTGLVRFAGDIFDPAGPDGDGTPATIAYFTRSDAVAAITFSGSKLYLAVNGPTADGLGFQGKVRAAGPWKSEAAAAKPDAPIVAPFAKAGDESAQVWWVPSSDHRGAVTQYQVTAAPGGATKFVGGSVTTATFDGLTPGTSYTFTVKAIDPQGTSAASAASNAVKPTAPPPNPPFSTWVAFVQTQYQDLLNRPPTSGETSLWVTALSGGSKTMGDLDDSLRRSTENTTNVDPVARLYRAFLGRAPDAGGLRFWIKRRRTGTWTLTRIADYFANSNEFTTKYGTLTNRQFVTRIYTDVLGRAADTAGVNYWTGKLDRHEKTRGGVMVGFSESSEYKRKQAENTDVAVAYILLMSRAPSTTETSDWTTREKAGTATHAQLLTELLSSGAYATYIQSR